MKQSGYIHDYSEKDYHSEDTIFGAVDINPSADWTKYLPVGEKQSKDYVFDTMSCTTFSALNTIETWMKYLDESGKLSQAQKDALADFYIDGEFNISDRFTAIMGGTTQKGASFRQIWDSIRKDGILPEKDLPFGGNNWDEYHDKSVITEEMKAKAKSYLKVLIFAYSWASVPNLKNELKQSPIQIAFPVPGTHAVMSVADKKIFNTYKPFLQDYTGQIHYALKPWVYVANVDYVEPKKEYKYFSPKEIVGLKPELVEMLDKARGLAGIPFIINSGYRSKTHNKEVGGVENSSHTTGLAVDLSAPTDSKKFAILKALLDVGFNRIGVYATHIHADMDSTKSQNVLWKK